MGPIVRLLAGFSRSCRCPRRRAWSAAPAGGGPAAPAVHSEDTQVGELPPPVGGSSSGSAGAGELRREGGEREEISSLSRGDIRRSPFASSLKLESSEVGPPADPSLQQKRRHIHAALEGVICVGWDGSPLAGAGDYGEQPERRPEDDYKQYFEHHKPSPLSELELADTRSPLRRATDSDVVEDDAGAATAPPPVWKEDQGDGVEAALLGAEAQFRQAVERGDPNTPHGRVLADYHRAVT
ncbi:unnamed protein product [Spirodela intermedia]|uniref:Uncharacterized protein n=1 Tax=Spirodela intermedia TaxID=51605 RepID=A0A7I8JY75_SPIIN|nr:unnamed protein product [Spirodela intermedia]